MLAQVWKPIKEAVVDFFYADSSETFVTNELQCTWNSKYRVYGNSTTLDVPGVGTVEATLEREYVSTTCDAYSIGLYDPSQSCRFIPPDELSTLSYLGIVPGDVMTTLEYVARKYDCVSFISYLGGSSGSSHGYVPWRLPLRVRYPTYFKRGIRVKSLRTNDIQVLGALRPSALTELIIVVTGKTPLPDFIQTAAKYFKNLSSLTIDLTPLDDLSPVVMAGKLKELADTLISLDLLSKLPSLVSLRLVGLGYLPFTTDQLSRSTLRWLYIDSLKCDIKTSELPGVERLSIGESSGEAAGGTVYLDSHLNRLDVYLEEPQGSPSNQYVCDLAPSIVTYGSTCAGRDRAADSRQVVYVCQES